MTKLHAGHFNPSFTFLVLKNAHPYAVSPCQTSLLAILSNESLLAFLSNESFLVISLITVLSRDSFPVQLLNRHPCDCVPLIRIVAPIGLVNQWLISVKLVRDISQRVRNNDLNLVFKGASSPIFNTTWCCVN